MDVSQLRKNHIVFVRFGESCHYSVIRSVNGRTVTLADPLTPGEIKMKREIFSRIFTGNVLVVERPDDY